MNQEQKNKVYQDTLAQLAQHNPPTGDSSEDEEMDEFMKLVASINVQLVEKKIKGQAAVADDTP